MADQAKDDVAKMFESVKPLFRNYTVNLGAALPGIDPVVITLQFVALPTLKNDPIRSGSLALIKDGDRQLWRIIQDIPIYRPDQYRAMIRAGGD